MITDYDPESTSDATYDGPSPYHQPLPSRRRHRILQWWWASAIVSTAAFLITTALGTQYAAVTHPSPDNATWTLMRGLGLTLLLASVASWHALAQAKLILRCRRREHEEHLEIVTKLERLIAVQDGHTQLADAAIEATARLGGRVLRGVDG